MRNLLTACALTLLVGGCASTSTVPLAQDTIQITARAAPVCGPALAEKVALKQAAVETIRRGFDRFVVLNAQASGTYRGNDPVYVQRLGGGLYSASGGDAIIAPNQALTIKMFKDGDPQGGNALSARDTRRIGRSKSRKIASPVFNGCDDWNRPRFAYLLPHAPQTVGPVGLRMRDAPEPASAKRKRTG